MTSQSNVWWQVSMWEFYEAQRRIRDAADLPRGRRAAAYRSIASDYGIATRTVYRWARYTVESVRCGKFEALFVIGSRRPSQVTPWERAA
jgi:hypothetical protein